MLGEGAELGHGVDRLPVGASVSTSAVGDHTRAEGARPEVTQVLLPRGTPTALPTGGHERHRNVIAHFQFGDFGSDLDHHAGSFVPADDRQQ